MTGDDAQGDGVEARVKKALEDAGVPVVSIDVRHFPGEQIVLVEVADKYEQALTIASALDLQVPNGFVTVRKATLPGPQPAPKNPVTTIDDPRVTKLIELLKARSRASETQPSLEYVDAAEKRLSVAMTARHHLIFGRRGVGKTALMLEAKRRLDGEGAQTFWANVQPMRILGYAKAFLTIANRLCDIPALRFVGRQSPPMSVRRAQQLQEDLRNLLKSDVTEEAIGALLPQLQQLFALFGAEAQAPLFIFVDDVHYLPRQDVPRFLDMLHAVSRDNRVWLKVAGVKHQMRWFSNEQQVGLQTGHDADALDLDVTLEEPKRAREFLEDVLKGYVNECNSAPLRGFLNAAALDRLVLASGGVPRDFLTLCAAAIEAARARRARQAGVQDVTHAAGRAAQVKLRELEDDAAASLGSAEAILRALEIVRNFLLGTHATTFMRVDTHDKEVHASEYDLIQSLMDLRMLHLVHASLSAPHEAGTRSEVYLLDLSEYSASRLRQGIAVLDFEHGHIIWKRTRSGEAPDIGDTSRRLVTILRRGPMFGLSLLSGLLTEGKRKRTKVQPITPARRTRQTKD